MKTLELYKLGLTASDEWRCRQCGYAGRLITQDSYKTGFSTARSYHGGFLRCPNPGCLAQGSFMKRSRFDQVARFYEWDAEYDQAEIEVQQALGRLHAGADGAPNQSLPPTPAETSIPA